jgi:predicted sugar kinase
VKAVYRETRTIRREYHKWENGAKVEIKPAEDIAVTLEIDIDDLFATLGRKAATSIGGKAVEAGGLVTMRRRKS